MIQKTIEQKVIYKTVCKDDRKIAGKLELEDCIEKM